MYVLLYLVSQPAVIAIAVLEKQEENGHNLNCIEILRIRQCQLPYPYRYEAKAMPAECLNGLIATLTLALPLINEADHINTVSGHQAVPVWLYGVTA